MPESRFWLLRDIRAARKQGPESIRRRQQARLADIVAYARARSPYYRQLYHGVPDQITNPAQLPVTSKAELMPRFDDWVTDPDVTLAKVRAHVEDPSLIGEKFLGRYTVATTSGTSGARGIFLTEDRAMAVGTTLIAARIMPTWLGPAGLLRIVARGGRMAAVVATDGHFAAYVGATQMRNRSRLGRKQAEVFSVHSPLPELVDALNRFQPAVIIGYASVIALLAGEQESGRLRIRPVLVQPGGETLAAGEYQRIARAFNATVRDGYAATECLFMAYRCQHGWLHVNADWVLLEPVDADHQPVPPGQRSHTVLLTNLANRIQPILRYDLGDSIEARPQPCPCGDPLPAIGLQGRAGDVLTFPTHSGDEVAITPLAFGTLIDRTPGVELFPDRTNRADNVAGASAPGRRRRCRPDMARSAHRDRWPAHHARSRQSRRRTRPRTTRTGPRGQVPHCDPTTRNHSRKPPPHVLMRPLVGARRL
ncbi:phenylacetate--CoA ligase family protein [Pseudonocardia sp. MH-G8]|uniref:phenylacetate--CoA ligase family protein n=1 Tax=Pseudonocardia sp. MH-G8 TaxID=1854588 RepID=UPI001E366796|nr:phenylacetate--CoA ligase family protein [Pseudonocardia sp. MH-G8]